MEPIREIPLSEIQAAQKRIQSSALRTPIVSLNVAEAPAQIFLKLENLQPIGSFKLRGAANAILLATRSQIENGVFTASAGNMAQGVAWNAKQLGIPCNVIVPEHAPQTKIASIERLGAKVIRVPFDDWWNTMLTHRFEGMNGLFIHPVSDAAVIAGNGTIGLEILEDLPDVEAILVPFGGGGLSSGIASAVRALNPSVKVYGCEVETAAPLSASFAAGAPAEVPYTPSFVDGIGGKSMLPEMWPLVSSLLAGSLVVTLQQIAEAIRLLAERNRVIAEGAGAASLAAALSSNVSARKIVCVISGGNIDSAKLAKILLGEIP